MCLTLLVSTKKGDELTSQPFFPGQNLQKVSFSWSKPCLSHDNYCCYYYGHHHYQHDHL